MRTIGLFVGLLFLQSVATAATADAADVPSISTACGDVIGVWIDGVASFMGIPYAKPPIGPLRWRRPQPTCWTDNPLNASTPSNICYQFGYASSPAVQSEDCLYLNVYTSQLPTSGVALKPVLFWIHGGSLIGGSAYAYNVQNLAKLMDVVVVSINYRLNSFGFMALKELADEGGGVSGNYGIMDQILALQWVQTFILSFGGDPKRVTVIGQSSGGTSIFALLSSAQSKNLFAGAISLSGSPNITMDLATAYTQNKEFLDATNCAKKQNIGACLRNLSVEDVLKATSPSWNFIPLGYPFPPNASSFKYPGLVVVDGVTVTLPFADALATRLIDVPLILQGMSQELELFSTISFNNLTRNAFKDVIIGGFSDGYPNNAGQTVVNTYPFDDTSITNDYLFYQMLADLGLQCGNLELALQANFQSPIYISIVDTRPASPYVSPFTGVAVDDPFHMWDYITAANDWKIFCSTDCPGCCNYKPQPIDFALGQVIREMWSQFVTSLTLAGTPCLSVSESTANTIYWCHPTPSGMENVPNFRAKQCKAWSEVGFGEGQWWCD